jgi:hypothetical protein
MDKETKNEFKEILILLKKALAIYVNEGQEKIKENEEYELYKQQYPFDEYYYFKEEFKCKWE